jgi:hypothetical protein
MAMVFGSPAMPSLIKKPRFRFFPRRRPVRCGSEQVRYRCPSHTVRILLRITGVFEYACLSTGFNVLNLAFV